MSDGTMQNGGIFDEYVNFVKSFLDELKNHHVDFVFFIKERNYFNDDKKKISFVRLLAIEKTE